MTNHQNTLLVMALGSLGALALRLVENRMMREPQAVTQLANDANATHHQLISLDEDDAQAGSSESDESASTEFGTLTSLDIVKGFYIIREWEFVKYKFNDREKEIARMMLDGMSNKQIALKACLAVSSVKYHVSSIFRKTSLTNRNDFGSLIKRGMAKSTRQWSSRGEMNKELELLRNHKCH